MYTVQYFIDKFQAIPESKWVCGSFTNGNGAHCANGHCGVQKRDFQFVITREGQGLAKVMSVLHLTSIYGRVIEDRTENYSNKAAHINNGLTLQYQQPAPKQRILAALMDIKKMEEVEISDPPVYVEDILREELVTI